MLSILTALYIFRQTAISRLLGYVVLTDESTTVHISREENDHGKHAADRDAFVSLMESEGYDVRWESTRKYITYTTPDGMRCRDSKLHEELPPPAGAEGAGGRLHAHHAPSGRWTDLQSRRLFSEAAQRMIVAFVEIHFSKKIVIALPPRLRYVVLAK